MYVTMIYAIMEVMFMNMYRLEILYTEFSKVVVKRTKKNICKEIPIRRRQFVQMSLRFKRAVAGVNLKLKTSAGRLKDAIWKEISQNFW